MKNFKRLLSYAMKFWQQILLSFVCAALYGIISAAPPYFIQHTIDDIFIQQQHHLIIPFISIFFCMFLFKGIFMYATTYNLHAVNNKIITNIREDLFNTIINFPLKFFQEKTSGSLLAHFLHDAMIIQKSTQSLIKEGVRGIFESLFLFAYAFSQNSYLTAIMLIITPLLGYAIAAMGKARRKASTNIQMHINTISSHLNEIFIGIREIKAANGETIESERISKTLHQCLQSISRDAHLESLCPALVEIVSMSGASLALYCGMVEVQQGQLSAGQMISCISAIILAYQPLKKLLSAYTDIQHGLAASSRIFDLMDKDYEQPALNLNHATPLPALQSLSLEKLSFSHPGTPILNNISITINQGDIIGIIGPSGSGKSTFCDLILGFVVPTDGRIVLNNTIVLSPQMMKELRRHIGYVGQTPFLFNDTVARNVAYNFPEASTEDVINACRQAHAHEFIEQLPHGYNTIVGENGSFLSGGQKQRITIARALIRNPSLYIFDEPTSSLDHESERLIQASIASITQHKTAIIVSHRPKMLERVTRLITLDHQTITERTVPEQQRYSVTI